MSGSDMAFSFPRRDFRALNSDFSLVCAFSCCRPRLSRAESWLHTFEARFSRFRATSELSRLNQSNGNTLRASPGLFGLVQYAVSLEERSGGLFDPVVLAALEWAGYERSFELIGDSAKGVTYPPRKVSFEDIRLDPDSRDITLQKSARIDLGSIGKGWAVDRLRQIVGSPSLVTSCGDVFAAGRPEIGRAWTVGIADPFQPEHDLAVVETTDRALATSSVLRRRWRQEGVTKHHLIDPRTSIPSDSDVVQSTVLAGSAAEADYQAKLALLLGSEAGLSHLDAEDNLEGLLVLRDGSLRTSRGFDKSALAG